MAKNGGRSSSGNDGTPEDPSRREESQFSVNRRDFLKLAGAVSAAATACEPQSGGATGVASVKAAQIIGDLPIDFSFAAVRKEDFVVLRFDFINMGPDGHHRTLERLDTGPAFVIVNFQSQHVFEPAIFEGEAATPPSGFPPLPIGSRLSGASRVVFTVPEDFDPVDLSLEGLLELVSGLDMNLAPNALPTGDCAVAATTAAAPLQVQAPTSARASSRAAKWARQQRTAFAAQHWHQLTHMTLAPDPVDLAAAGKPQEPVNHETAIEIPYRLLLSPDRNGAWAHAASPVTSSSGRIEMWHTRLGVRKDGGVDEEDPTCRRARAIWTRDEGFDPDDRDAVTLESDRVFHEPLHVPPILDTIEPRDRYQIVHLTSNFEAYQGTGPDPLPRPVNVNRLMLTSMGGWLDVRGDWADGHVALEQWEHRATIGRDHYVKLVHKGVLYPFGHRAALIEISQRKFKKDEHEHIAFLRKRFFIVVREPEKLYEDGRSDDSSTDAQSLRKLPFTSIKVTTLTTPNLDVTTNADSFIPRTGGTMSGGKFSGGKLFRFAFEALDVEGNIVRFTAPVVWIPINDTLPENPTYKAGIDLYNDELSSDDKKCALAGQRFAYAKSVQNDDTAFETQSITFDAFPEVSDVLHGSYPKFLPFLQRAELIPESIRHVAGTENALRAYTYHPSYVQHAFKTDPGTNAGEMLLKLDLDPLLAQSPVFVQFKGHADRSGGFVDPSFLLMSLSRRIGPVAGDPKTTGDTKAIDGDFEPAEFFGGLSDASLAPKIFGIIDLFNILAKTKLDKAPKYFTEVLSEGVGAAASVERLANDLASVEINVPNALPAVQKLVDDLDDALDPDSPDQAAAAARLAADITAAISDLGNVASLVNGVKPVALANDLVQRATALATALPGAVTQLLQLVSNLALGAEFPKQVQTHLTWHGKVKAWPDDLKLFQPNHPEPDGTQDSLLLAVDITARAAGGGQAQVDLRCSLEDFSINLFASDGDAHFLTLVFDNLTFRIVNGKKPDVSVKLTDIHFAGPLKFVETLRNLIPLDGFSDPPNIDVTSEGITAGFSIGLPNIGIGVFSLENINLGAQLDIPFIGRALTFSFNFSTRDNPFNLTVALLGGGGFFGLRLSPAGVEMLEASLEAGARISIDLGVASGSVSAMIGVYFRIEKLTDDENRILLTGYFRIRGEVDVLGIITASLTLTLELEYQAEPTNKLTGRASLEIEIDVAFFSASVTVTCERRFAGSNGDPTFLDIMKPDGDFKPWNEYLAAFAA